MAWIKVIEQHEASEPLRLECERAGSQRGVVANILRIHSIKPAAMRAHLDLYMALMFGTSPLSRREREVVAVAVSAANGCHY